MVNSWSHQPHYIYTSYTDNNAPNPQSWDFSPFTYSESVVAVEFVKFQNSMVWSQFWEIFTLKDDLFQWNMSKKENLVFPQNKQISQKIFKKKLKNLTFVYLTTPEVYMLTHWRSPNSRFKTTD